MELWLVVDGPEGLGAEVAVDVEPAHTMASLADALAARLGLPSPTSLRLFSARQGAEFDPLQTVHASGLRFGDRVLLGVLPRDSGPRRTGNTVAAVVVIGGPCAGTRFPLGLGEYVLGRSSLADLVVDDPALSRRHVRFIVRDSGVSVVDAGSSNGTFLDGAAATAPTDVVFGAVVEAGHSLLRVDAHRPAASVSTEGDGGVVRFNRPPRLAVPHSARLYACPAPPQRAAHRKLPMVSAVGPLLLGVPMLGLGVAQGNTPLVVMGGVSMLGSPLLALASHAEDRRSGRGAFAQEQLAYYDGLAKLSSTMATALADEVADRRRRSPDAGDLTERATRLRSNLWERRSDDPDYLQWSAGFADQPSHATVEYADGGDEQLRGEAAAELGKWAVARNVPVVIDTVVAGVVGLCGESSAVAACARWAMCQLATLHSPRDLVIAVAAHTDDQDLWSWTPWLPHLRSDSSPIEGRHLAIGDAAALFERLTAVVRSRRAEAGGRLADAQRPVPTIVVFVSERLQVPRASVTTLLEDGPGAGVYVVWLGSRADHLPGECGAVLDVRLTPPSFDLVLPNTGETLPSAVLDQLSLEAAREIATSLAAVKDVTAGGARGQIPRSVALLDLLGMPSPTADAVARRWQLSGFGVDAPVGVSAGGTFVLDMRHDGPHALVGGTTGAGKSELLQSFVAALAASHPPTRVTFLLVDYKGGAAFKDAVHLPHTVGFVTDLDGHLVHRALVSLNAELRRREHLLRDHGAKDLLEMERRVPEAAPPALLLIIDEFASLAKELPDFVDGVVNVAQRGRSLGIHLILATQRPAGSINDNVRANTNLRIALRMNDAADSEDVIAARDAALLPRSLPGRSFARTGQAELTEVQIAYVGGHTVATHADVTSAVEVMDLQLGQVHRRTAARAVADDAATDLQVLVAAIGEAARAERMPAQQPPWLPPLPQVLPLRQLAAAGADHALMGLVDLPAEQSQAVWSWQLEDDGSMLIYGTSGSGKTSLLRTLTASLAEQHAPTDLHMYALDFATRGLQSLDALPHVGDVIAGDDIERVQRLIVMLEREMVRRKDLFAEAGVSLLSEYRRVAPDEIVPRIVVLFDGYGSFAQSFEKIDFGEWIERIPRLVGEGRPLGIHWAITADRRNAVGITLGTTVSSKVVLRMADDDDYSTLGLDGRVARAAQLTPGRGFVAGTVELQVALVGDDPAGDAQAAAMEHLGVTLRERWGDGTAPRVGSLPLVVPLHSLPTAMAACATVGLGQSHLAAVTVDLFDGNLLIAGPNRSGRSTALATIACSLRSSTPAARLFVLTPRRSPLSSLDVWERSARGADECDGLAGDLLSMIDDRDGSEPPVVVFVDDGNELADTPADAAIERLVRRGRDVGLTVIGAAESTSALRSYGGWIPEIRKDRRALLLNPDPDIDGDLVAARLPRRAGGGLPPGRGYLVLDGAVELVQTAS